MRQQAQALGTICLGISLLAACSSAAPPRTEPTIALGTPAPAPLAIADEQAEPKKNPESLREEPKTEAKTESKPEYGPSCDGRAGTSTDCQGISCCERLPVPGGILAYQRDGGAATESRTIRPFRLDRFEVTVGRFRSWVDAKMPTPKAGDVLYDDQAGHVVRWSQSAKIQDEKHLAGWKRYDTWSAGVESRPKNFVSWYTAAAFCAWDGGRLPTDAEWMYVARGGDENRPYPWGSDAPTPEHAVFNCMGDGNASCALQDILPVGSRPKGVGRWGHYDLAGSMFEWTLQGTMAQNSGDPVEKARGGGFCYIGGVDRRAQTHLKPAVFRQESPETVSHMTGFRCAYDG